MDPLFLAALVLSILLLSSFWYKKTSLNVGGKTPPLPPGPVGLPILGYLPFLGRNVLHQFSDMGHQYGPIFKVWLGSKLCVVISSPSLIKQVVRDHDSIFANRDVPVAAYVLSRGATDILFSPCNAHWRATRKALVREMQSSSALEASYELRKEQLRKAIRFVYSKIGQPVDLGELAFVTELNLIMNLLWGGILSGNENERLGAELRVLISKLNHVLGIANVSDFFPLLSRLDLQRVKKQTGKIVEGLEAIVEPFIFEHEKLSVGIKNEGRKDFLQILLELREKNESDMPNLSPSQLKPMLLNIITGGTDPSATTVEFAMAELLNNPEDMEKVQKELFDVVGMNNTVEESHLPMLKYLNAVVKETFRLHPPAPFLVPRSPDQTSTVGGYTIPKNTRVLLNIWAMQRDPSIWESPTKFKPDRFLDDAAGNLDYKGNNFEYLPFGSGRRICPGISLGERMVTYMLASLLHSFDWKPYGGNVDMSETFGIMLRKTNPILAIPSPRLSATNLYV